MRSLDRSTASRLKDHVGQRETRQVLSHVISDVRPDAQQDALALVVTGAVHVGFAEVAGDDRAVNRRDYLGQRDPLDRSREHVAPADAPLGAHESDTLQTQEDLFQVRLRKARSMRQVAHRGRRREIRTQCEAQ